MQLRPPSDVFTQLECAGAEAIVVTADAMHRMHVYRVRSRERGEPVRSASQLGDGLHRVARARNEILVTHEHRAAGASGAPHRRASYVARRPAKRGISAMKQPTSCHCLAVSTNAQDRI